MLTTHYLDEAEMLCTNMAIINKGLIIKQGPIKALLASMEDESVTIDLDRTFENSDVFMDYAPVLHEATIDITISRQHPLDTALKLLHEAGYIIKNIRPKSGRLEEFFIRNTNS